MSDDRSEYRRTKEYRENHAARMRERNKTPERKKYMSKYMSKYCQTVKWKSQRERYRQSEKYKKWKIQRTKDKKSSSPKFKLSWNIRTGIRLAIKEKKNGRHWEDLVGYTAEELMSHLESKFKIGMSWENYGQWHVDHIIPQSLWEFDKPEDNEFKKCWSLANLQPLWAEENLIKGNKILEV